MIIIDSFDPGGPVQSLETVDFQKVVAGRLAEDGIAVFQTDSPTVKVNSFEKRFKVFPRF